MRRGVRTRRRLRTIGVLSLDASPHGRATAYCAVERAARGSDYCASVVSVPVVNRGSLMTAVEQLRRAPVEGILLVAAHSSHIEIVAEIAAELSLVAVAAEPHDGLPVASVDHYSGAVAATRHLLELGHRTVFHIAGPADRPDARLRIAGWRDTLLAAGAEIETPSAGDWGAEQGYECGRRLGSRNDVTAIFAANDQMALGAMRAMSEAGRRVPQDVGIVGFDDIPGAEFFHPPLTTVRHDCAELGRRSVQLLRSEIEGGGQIGTHAMLPAELVPRASAAAVG